MNRKYLLEVTAKYHDKHVAWAGVALLEPTEAEMVIASQPIIKVGYEDSASVNEVSGMIMAFRLYRDRTKCSLVDCMVAFYRAARPVAIRS